MLSRGLRSIMEGILLDTMFDLPSLEGVEEVVVSKEVLEGTARPPRRRRERNVGRAMPCAACKTPIQFHKTNVPYQG
jgi:ATP-dependent protease Clp ATPase subunit